MIEITVNGIPLTLYSDTTLNVELNNALFSGEAIEGDVIYSFEIPVTETNWLALGFENMVQVRGREKRECAVYVNGIQWLGGWMVVQKATKEKITTAVICNPYPEGFAERSLCKNEGKEIVVAENLYEHESKWKEFLAECTTGESDIQFAPFVDEETYGTDNEDFGFWEGYNEGKVVNRILVNNGAVEDGRHGNYSRTFNREIDLVEEDGLYVEKNQNCLCPQIRLSAVLREVMKNAGFKLKDNLNDELQKIYLQTVKLLDGNITQYAELYKVSLNLQNISAEQMPNWNTSNWNGNTDGEYYLLKYDGVNYGMTNNAGTFRVQDPGRYHIEISWQMARNTPYRNKEITLYIYKGNGPTGDDILIKHSLGTPEWNEEENFFNKEKFAGRIYIPETFCNQQLKITARQENYWTRNSVPAFVTLYMKGPVKCTIENSLNIFAGKFKTSELLPNVKNADFIRNIIKGLGWNYFTDGRKRIAEISSFRDILDAGSIDITDIAEIHETENTKTETKKVKFKVSPLQEFNTENENFMGETELLGGEPVFEQKNEVYLYKPANGYMKAEEEEDGEHAWKCVWKLKGGNAETLDIGEGDEEKLDTGFKVPANTTQEEYAQREYSNIPYGFGNRLPNITLKMTSPMSEDIEENPSEIIILYDRGYKSAGEYEHGYRDMSAVDESGLSLKAKGRSSLGERYMKPYIKVTNLTDTVTYKMRIDTAKALQIMELVAPQDKEPQNQTRFLYCNGVKTVPKKIKFQIENNASGTVLCEIEAAKMN